MARKTTIKFQRLVICAAVLNVFGFGVACSSRYATRGARMTNDNLRQHPDNRETFDCTEGQITCKSGNQCIPYGSHCDGKYDCEDFSDESNFACKHYPKCPKGMFRCKYGGCIHSNLLCNKIKDCMDRSDEDSHICSSSHVNSTTTTKKPPKASSTKTAVRSTTIQTPISSTTAPRCQLPPPSADKSYTVHNLLNQQVPQNQTVPVFYSLLINCNSGYLLGPASGSSNASQHYYSNCTSDGTWNPLIRDCLRICDPITHPKNAVLECAFEGFLVSCSGVLLAGTQVTSRCDDLQVSSKLNPSSSSINCAENGEWDGVLHDCSSNSEPNDNFGNEVISTAKAALLQNAADDTAHASNSPEWLQDNNTLSISNGDLVTEPAENEKMWFIVIGVVLASIAIILQVTCTVLVVTKMIARLRQRYNIP